jgi:hypothetical protein
MVLQEPRELNRPAWAVTWRGNTEDGVLTGDQVVVQVSGVTGLPIAYSQRVAVRRPSRDEIKVTRTEAINAALDALAEVRAGDGELEAPHLAGQLVLSAAQHPEGGPAWLLSGTVDGDVVTFTVDAMSGELLAAAGDFEFEEDTVARDRPLDAEGLDGFGGQPAPEGDE